MVDTSQNPISPDEEPTEEQKERLRALGITLD